MTEVDHGGVPDSGVPDSGVPDSTATGRDQEPQAVVPRSATRPVSTRTSAAFGALDVGPPVSRVVTRPATPDEVAPPVPASAAPLPERCPTCNARTRGQQWCSLCHTDLRPAPAGATVRAAVPVPAATPESAAAGAPEAEQLALDFGVPAEPAPALDEEEVERMLRRLAAADVAKVPVLASKQAKVLVAIGGSVGLSAVLLGGMALLGTVTG